jgi:hypothetical protein
MTIAAIQQAPDPDGETAQLAAGLTGETAHEPHEPEPDPLTPEPGEPEPGEPGERQPEPLPTLALPSLRPYADPKAVVEITRRGIKASRRPARRLARRGAAGIAGAIRHTLAGTAALLGLLAGWLTGQYGKHGARLTRFGVAAAAVLGIAHTLADYPTEGTIGLALGWVVVGFAHRAGALDALLRKATGEQQKNGKKDGGKAPADDAQAPQRRGLTRWLRRKSAPVADEQPEQDSDEPPLTALIRELIGDDNGVHLQDLRPAMRARFPHLSGASDQQLRTVLIEAGFDPSRTFRAKGVAGRAGVHRDELPPPPSPGDGQGAERNSSPRPETAPDLQKSPPTLRRSPGVKSGRKGRRKLPEGWTAEEVERGFRIVDDPDAGPTAARVERLENTD